MSEPSVPQNEVSRGRVKTVLARLRRSFPFLSGILAAFLAFVLYNIIFIQPNQLTTRDVSNTVASVMASATPPPAYSSIVYQIIQPSLILVQVERDHDDADPDYSLDHR